MAAWRGLAFFRGDASFSTWLYRLTSNACMDLLRREQRRTSAAGPSLDDEEVNIDVPSPMESPQEAAERRELRAAIEAGLQSLPPDYRAVLILRELHQLTYDEIAQTVDADLGTVKSRLYRARNQLREILTARGTFWGEAPSKKAKSRM